MSDFERELGPNAYDALLELDTAFQEEDVDHRFLGGMAATAVASLDWVDVDAHNLVAPQGLYKPAIREGGSVRDADTLLMTTDVDEAIRATEIARDVLEGRLVFRAFRFKDHETHLTGFNAVRRRTFDFTSERTMDAEGNTYFVAVPFVTPVRPETYEPWTVQVGDRGTFQTVNPAVAIASYEVRSLGGTRPRNRSDVKAMRGRMNEVMDDYPAFEAETASDIHAFLESMQGANLRSVLRALAEAGELASFVARSRAIAYLDGTKWGVAMAQGEVPFGEITSKLLDRVAGSDKGTV